jgi:ubiquinone biosynthesis monooxygenase Coq7
MDALINGFDKALRTLSGLHSGRRPSPASFPEGCLDQQERHHAAALMRVNHSGEVCAQALYRAQSTFSKSHDVSLALGESAREEEDHLNWTASRLSELQGRRSALDPLWYLGAYAIGALAAKSGDAGNLGFLEETERQVVNHLVTHLERLPASDERSRQVVRQMIEDEAAHAELASDLGAADLPPALCFLMRLSAKVMTTVAYRL